MGKKGRPSKHQAAQVEVVRMPNRIGYSGRCRCGWDSPFVRATRQSAAKDAERHILESK